MTGFVKACPCNSHAIKIYNHICWIDEFAYLRNIGLKGNSD